MGGEMTDTYYVAFRIGSGGNRDHRFDAMIDTIMDVSSGKCWLEPSSFAVFASDLSSKAIVSRFSEVLDLDFDLAVVGMTEFKFMLIIGASNDTEIYDLVPGAKKI